jgi:DNA-binding transcriptional LysR family regulator
MTTITPGYEDELDLHQLQVLDVLLREHSLTRAARTLNVTQPALSKTLARLRRYFGDPLFVRVALRMEPTPKALQLQARYGRSSSACDPCAASMCPSIRVRHTAPSISAWSMPA